MISDNDPSMINEGTNHFLLEIDRIAKKKQDMPSGPKTALLEGVKEEIKVGLKKGLSVPDLCLALERSLNEKVSTQTMRRFLRENKLVKKRTRKKESL